MVATATFAPVLNDRDVSKFTGEPCRARHELMVQNQPASNSFRDGNGNQVVHTIGVAAKPELRKSTSIGRIFQLYRKSRAFLKGRLQIKIAPTQIGGEDEPL